MCSVCSHPAANNNDQLHVLAQPCVYSCIQYSIKMSCMRRAPPTTQFRPYDLEVVARGAVDPAEHFVISATGVVRVLGGLHSEHTSLLEWDRERRAYDHICTLGFFRNFINKRAFRTWRRVKDALSMCMQSWSMQLNACMHVHVGERLSQICAGMWVCLHTL